MDKTTKVFIKNLKRVMDEKKISEDELAKHSGIPRIELRGYFLGKDVPLLSEAIIICNCLNIDLEEICMEDGGDEPEFNSTSNEDEDNYKSHHMKIFIENLHKILEERKITQYELAKMTGISPACISNYMRMINRPVFEQVVIICKKLNISIDSMFQSNKVNPKLSMSYQNSDLKKIAELYYMLNVNGKNHLMTMINSLATNKDLIIN